MKISTVIRKIANAHNSCPIKIIHGDSPPEMVGKSYHYTTKGGSVIYHPSAYSKKGWSNMIYVNSTIRVEVGDNWLLSHKV